MDAAQQATQAASLQWITKAALFAGVIMGLAMLVLACVIFWRNRGVQDRASAIAFPLVGAFLLSMSVWQVVAFEVGPLKGVAKKETYRIVNEAVDRKFEQQRVEIQEVAAATAGEVATRTANSQARELAARIRKETEQIAMKAVEQQARRIAVDAARSEAKRVAAEVAKAETSKEIELLKNDLGQRIGDLRKAIMQIEPPKRTPEE